MKTFRYPDAFPLEDVGIHNAIKNLKVMKTKHSLDQVKRIFKSIKDGKRMLRFICGRVYKLPDDKQKSTFIAADAREPRSR